MAHPVNFSVEPPLAPRNRLTVAFRPILALPHALLVGGPVLGIFWGAYHTGVLGLAAFVLALFDWVVVIFTGKRVESLQQLKRYYLAWRARSLAYMAMLRDEYPPFGEAPYPAVLELPAGTPPVKNRVAVAFRPVLVIPQLVVLALLLVAWLVVAVLSWIEIVIAGRLSPGLWRLGRDIMRYLLRVEAFILLVHDEYPPFALSEPEERAAPAVAAPSAPIP